MLWHKVKNSQKKTRLAGGLKMIFVARNLLTNAAAF
jgi:hypothetical protein